VDDSAAERMVRPMFARYGSAMDLDTALTYASGHKNGVLITIRKDGRPQSSDIVYAVDGSTIKISVTDGRAKTANLRRDPRCVLHLTNPAGWSYLSFDCAVELTPVATAAADATVDELIEVYRKVVGEHDDWDEYRQAMVDDNRLVLRLTPKKVVGQING
jgi:PPOX class probable F420-dependent enzyme